MIIIIIIIIIIITIIIIISVSLGYFRLELLYASYCHNKLTSRYGKLLMA
jgi:hypothetical protein